MSQKNIFNFDTIKNMANDAAKNAQDAINSAGQALEKGAQNAGIDTDKVKSNIQKSGELLSKKADEIRQAANKTSQEVKDKLTELDRELESEFTNYNDAYTQMSDKGMALYVERMRSIDLISNVENLINSIANHPKTFDKEFEEIKTNRENFTGALEYADREIQEARKAASGAGAGLAAGATVAFMAPTAAMWVATTFGTASTGAAISTLAGAAAQNAALAWLGGGALVAGGGGMAAGNALLAMAGPVGWTIAGATLMTSIVLYSKNKMKLNKEKSEEIEQIKANTEKVKKNADELDELLENITRTRESADKGYTECLPMYKGDYLSYDNNQVSRLMSLVDVTRSLSAMLCKTI